MDFCLSGKGSEARSSQTATRPLAVLWFESLLLVWRLYSRTIRPVARFLFSQSDRDNCVRSTRNLSSPSRDTRPCRAFLRRSLVTSL
jgi:hypothetical protein